jgi:AraC-like DNA-binding protein
LRIETVKLLPGQEWTDAANAWRFVSLSSGAAYWLDPKRPRALAERELLVAVPGLKAVILASQLGPVVLDGFTFAPDSLWGFFTLNERQDFERAATAAGEAIRFLPSTHPVSRRFAALARQRELGLDLVARAEVLGLIAAFFSGGASPAATLVSGGSSAHGRFDEVICQMPDVELIRHSPEELARLCGCSTRHFNRLFRERFGQSPRARQTDLRLSQARQQLAESDRKVSEIALHSGYRSVSLFNALFKRRFGLSPSAWRQRLARGDGSAVS